MQPGMFKPPNDEGWLVRKVQDMERQLNELRSANIFGLTGIKPKDGGTDLDGFVNVNGDMTVNGTQVVNGPMTITGTLSLPAGIIGNDALASPIFTAAGYGDAYGFSVPDDEATVATATVPVPAGYTKATVTGIGAIYLYNSTATGNYGYGRVYVDWPTGTSNFGAKIPFALGANGGSGNSSPNRLVEKTGLDGGTITVRLVADSDNGVPAAAANQATINALVVFTR